MTPTQELVLDCYRSPHLLRSLADTAIPLPEGMDKVLRAAVDAPSGDGADTPPELREATLLYVKRVMLLEGADHYRLLGLRFDAPAEQIDAHYRWLVALLQLDKSMSTRDLSRRVGRICRAHAVLSDPRRRLAYNKARYGVLAGEDFDLPVEMLVESILKDQGRDSRQATTSLPPVTGELQPWRPPSKEAANEDAGVRTRRERYTTGETLVFRGPSDGALLAMSGAALLVIFAVSPVIVSRYSTYFMPQEPASTALTTETAAAPSQASVPPAIPEARSAPAAALSFLMPEANVPAAPTAIFAGGDGVPFDRAADEQSAAEEVPLDEPPAAPPETVATAARESLSQGTPAPPAKPAATARQQARQEALFAGDASLRSPLVAASSGETGLQRAVPAVSLAPAPAPAPASTAAATVPVNVIDSYDLDKLVERLAATYREGDTEGFVSLFAETARTNDQPDRLGIAADYAALFDATERRSLQLADVQWKQMESGAVGEGRFVVRLKPKWKKREEVVSGKLTLEVKRQEQDLAITGLFHDYGADARP